MTWEYDLDAWARVMRINVDGTFHCVRSVTPYMREQNYGRMVLIASIAGKEGNPNASGYSAAKAGVIGFTKSLGKELAKHDIAVNCITPAAARTAIFDQITQAHIDFMLSKIPRERFVLVEEIDLVRETGKPLREAIVEASVSRLRPVMLAAVTTILGMAPLLTDAFFVSMAITIMGGLAFATVLTLVAAPVFYLIFFRRVEKRELAAV